MVMGAEPADIGTLLAEIKSARQSLAARDERVAELERNINELLLVARRPGSESYADGRDIEHKSAIQMCIDRHSWQHQKNEGRWLEYTPGYEEIAEAITAQQAFRAILRHGDFQRLDHLEQKSLSAFNFDSGWVMPPRR
jgi:hypothetical protein